MDDPKPAKRSARASTRKSSSAFCSLFRPAGADEARGQQRHQVSQAKLTRKPGRAFCSLLIAAAWGVGRGATVGETLHLLSAGKTCCALGGSSPLLQPTDWPPPPSHHHPGMQCK